MTEDAAPPQWSDEAVAESFRTEIRTRFETHNAAYRARDAAELEEALRTHPEYRDQPGFEIRDSGAWSVYQLSEIRFDRNTVQVVLPQGFTLSPDLVHMFDHTTVAWSKPWISAILVNGEPRPTIEIVLVATWTDAMNAAWQANDRNGQRHVLADLTEADVHALCAIIDTADPGVKEDLLEVRDRLRGALEILP